MINFTVKHQDTLVGGLNFQIARNTKDALPAKFLREVSNFTDSIVVSEDAFSIIESGFASEFSADDRRRIYYHHGFHSHDTESVKSIIDKLIEKKRKIEQEGIDTKEMYWFTAQEIKFLNQNRSSIFNFIDEIIVYLENSIKEPESKGVYVIGI